MFIGKFSSKKQTLNEKDLIWNRFIDTIYSKDIELSSMCETMRMAAICFIYDAEMYQGGHSGFFEYHSDISIPELADALRTIVHDTAAENMLKAQKHGESDDYRETDAVFMSFEVSVTDHLREFVYDNREEIFGK